MVSEGTLEGLKLCAMPLDAGLLTWGVGRRAKATLVSPGQAVGLCTEDKRSWGCRTDAFRGEDEQHNCEWDTGTSACVELT